MDDKEILIRLLLAFIAGGVIGLERERSNKFAGFRTHILVSVGSCVATITSLQLFFQYQDMSNLDPARLTAQILSGIGFLGAGTIIKTSNGVVGLTTAAGIWFTACIGISIGYGYYFIGSVSSMILILVVYILKFIDSSLKKIDARNVILKVKDKATLVIVLELLDTIEVDTNKITIEKIDDEWIIEFDLLDKDNFKLNDMYKLFCEIDENICIDYSR